MSTKEVDSPLIDDALHILQFHDEWMEKCEEESYIDTGEALDLIDAFKAIAERIVNNHE